tara:strand:+ start:70 stop:1440 length:1371 start_codon:yes stop_codon:yes gene_type:complete
MFNTLNENFEKIVNSLKGKAIISESDLDSTIREIRIALLEADVAISVVKDFVENIKSNIIGQEVLKSIKPDQMIIKLVHDELVKILGSDNESLKINNTGLTKFLFCGLQGSGKTTTVAKVANYIKKNSRKKILLVSADIYRPAAQEQLQVLSQQIQIDYLKQENLNRVEDITKKSLEYASQNLYDILLFDTAGRQTLDSQMMDELKLVTNYLKPEEKILVADSLTGQDAANIAKNFHSAIEISAIILTRIDGDGRGGAALSIKSITGAPIKFIGTGEKIDNLEAFYPERIAKRILGMGDIVSLVEKASENIDKKEAEELAKKMFTGRFDLEDFASQLNQMRKMGGVTGVMTMLPGISKTQKMMAENNISDDLIKKQISIIYSMTKKERSDPDIIKASRKIRISNGSGTRVQDVNKLLKQFLQSRKMMKKMKSIDQNNLPTDLLNKFKGSALNKFNF